MKSLWRLVKREAAGRGALEPASGCAYESTITLKSETTQGVSFTIRRMSFGRRMELCRSIKELGRQIEYVQCGEELSDKAEAALLGIEIDRLYLKWGLVELSGLAIDGEAAAVEALFQCGPEMLVREIVLAIHAQCGLTGEERKN